jgi:predicted O-methyltransferase YrrM
VDIAKLLEKHTFSCSSINEHLRFLYDTAVTLQAKTIVELGVSWGQSTIPLAAAAKTNGGHLYSCDTEGYSDAVKHAVQNVKDAGLDDVWTFVRASSLTWSFDKPIDLLFLDTSHEKEDTRAELALWMPKVRKGGMALFHDTVAFKDGVEGPILEYLAAHPGEYEYENRPNNNGLGVLTKLAESKPAIPEGVNLTIAYSICGDGSIGSSPNKAALEKRLEALLVVMDKANRTRKYPEIVVATGWPATLDARCTALVQQIKARARMITTPENKGSAVHSSNTLGALWTIRAAIDAMSEGTK